MNRFFYKCSRCLLKVAIDAERQPYFDPCPVCDAHYGVIKFLGATKGVLSMQTKCNDVCTFAEGPNCSCSCAGANHGSRIVVPVLGKVLDLDASRFPGFAELSANYQRFTLEMGALIASRPSSLGKWVWDGVIRRIYEGGSYPIRFTRLAGVRTEYGIPAPAVPAPLVVIPSPAVAAAGPSAAPSRQLLLF